MQRPEGFDTIVGEKGVSLSGGSTPRRTYEVLASAPFCSRMDWTRVDFFWGDERYVPSDHPDSNFHMTMEALLSQVPVPPANVHRIRTELSPAEAVATNYESEIARFFAAQHHAVPHRAAAPFAAHHEPELCVGCGTCVDRCQMEALTLEGAVAELNLERCIGCGLCVSTCPDGALRLERKPASEQPPVPLNTVDTYLRLGQARGKLGALAPEDRAKVRKALRQLIP